MRTRLTLIVLPLLMACSVLALLWMRADQRARATDAWTRSMLDSASTTVTLPEPPQGLTRSDSLYWKWSATNAHVHVRRLQAELIRQRTLARTLLEESEQQDLKRQGITDPNAQLRDSLTGHRELIPYPEQPPYDFYDREGIVILTPPYVFAPFDNGHNGGFALLKYQALLDGRVAWERVWSVLE